MPGITLRGWLVLQDKTLEDFMTLEDFSHTIQPHAHANLTGLQKARPKKIECFSDI